MTSGYMSLDPYSGANVGNRGLTATTCLILPILYICNMYIYNIYSIYYTTLPMQQRGTGKGLKCSPHLPPKGPKVFVQS